MAFCTERSSQSRSNSAAAAAGCARIWLSLITSAGDEMQVASALVAFQDFGIRGMVVVVRGEYGTVHTPAPCEKTARSGAP